MKKINIKATACLLMMAIGFSGCKDYLEYDYPIDGTIQQEELFSTDRHARGFLNATYFGLGNTADKFGVGLGSGLDEGRFGELNGEISFAAGSDEAVSANLSSSINILNNGSWSPTSTYNEYYTEAYFYLRRANLFLESAPASAIDPASDIPKLMGEALFLRAFYHFELMKRYGGIILATHSFNLEDNLDLPKNTFDEVVAQIVKDCDDAAASISYATYLEQPSGERGRATKVAALALKARTLLYAASPLNNPAGDAGKWSAAANAAKDIIDISVANSGNLGLATQVQLPNLWIFSSLAFNKEVILSAQTWNTNSIDQLNAPPSYDGAQGRTNPTQDLVDAFEMRVTGKPINTAGSAYNPAQPYAGRDNRFGLFINYNTEVWRPGSAAIDVTEGGKDRNPADVDQITQTGYYLGKYLSTTARYGTGGSSSARRAWIFFRYAEVLLNYAEALNEAGGSTFQVLEAVNQVRARVALAPLQTTNPVGNGYVADNKDAIRERIHNERRVELCFEDHRFFDVRRWKLGEQFFNKPVKGVRITGTAPNYIYEYYNAQTRVFSEKMYRFPFPQSELNKTTQLVQNTGW